VRLLFGLLLACSVLLSLAFALALGSPRKHEDRPMAWFLACTAWAAVALDGAMLVLVLGLDVPEWVFAVALLAQDALFGWRLWLLMRARQPAEEGERS
jgi:hypothetical protein